MEDVKQDLSLNIVKTKTKTQSERVMGLTLRVTSHHRFLFTSNL